MKYKIANKVLELEIGEKTLVVRDTELLMLYHALMNAAHKGIGIYRKRNDHLNIINLEDYYLLIYNDLSSALFSYEEIEVSAKEIRVLIETVRTRKQVPSLLQKVTTWLKKLKN